MASAQAADDDIASQIIGPLYIPGSAGPIFGYQGLYFYSGNSPGCSKNIGILSIYLDAQKLGFSSSVATNDITGWGGNGGISIFYLYGIHNGVFNSACMFSYGTETVSGTANLVPGCVNVNTTNSWDYNNENNWPNWSYPSGECS